MSSKFLSLRERLDRRRRRLLASLVPIVALALLASAPAAAQQRGSVSGRVVDPVGTPLANAAVLVVGTTVGTYTNAEGHFVIAGLAVGHEVTLRVTLLGYSSVTVNARVPQSDINITLRLSAINLDEIIVTGTASGQQVKRTLGNSVADINAEKVLEVMSIADVGSLINARTPGVVITSGSGQAGSGPTINIRGVNSFSLSGQPLIYIDGVRQDNRINTGIAVQGRGVISRLNDINPEDIESVEIIKGPAAATLYGTEAANGVIQILTKKGRVGAPEINLRIRQGATWFLNAEDRIEPNWGLDPVTGQPYSLNLFQHERELGNAGIFQTGHLQGYTASLQGGTESLRYFLSGDLDRDGGIEPANKLFRFGTRANLTVQASDKLQLAVNVGLINGRTDLACEGSCGGIYWATMFGIPSTRDNPAFRGFRSYPPEIPNEAYQYWQDLSRSQISMQADYRPTEWLSARLTVGQDRVAEDDEQLAQRMPDSFAPYYGRSAREGMKYHSHGETISSTFDGSVTARYSPFEGIEFSTNVGAQYFRHFRGSTSANGTNFPAPGLEVVNSLALNYGGESYSENNTVGVFVQEQIGFNDRLFLTGAIRGDDNSAFGANYEFVVYPKGSLSWVMSEEDFWNVPYVDAFKLRIAYGQSGQQPSSFAALRTYSPETGGGGVAIVTPSAVGNADLGPEVGEEFEVGFDAGLFDSRLGVDFTFYHALTRDAILSQTVPPSTGFPGSKVVNAGKIQNVGVEVGLNALVLQRENLSVDMNLNFSTNRNEVLDRGDLPENSLTYPLHFPVASIFSYKVVSADLQGTGTAARAVNVMCDGGNPNGKKLPDGTPLELGGPPVPCSQAPRLYLGQRTPTFEGSFGTTVTLFKNLRLYGLLDWKQGWRKSDNNTRARCQVFFSCRESFYPEEYDPVRIAQIQSPGTLVDFVMSDASYLKLRELSATYNFSPELAQRVNAKRASISVAGRNLAIWSPWTSIDPESGTQESAGYTSLEQTNTPNLTSIVVTLNLTF